jgi:hypothetical protein
MRRTFSIWSVREEPELGEELGPQDVAVEHLDRPGERPSASREARVDLPELGTSATHTVQPLTSAP